MFKKSNDKSQELDKVQTLIGPSIEVNGDFVGQGDVVVEGKLSGTLKTKKDLKVGPAARIEADVEAENIFVEGEIKGSVKANKGIEMGASSKVTGDVETGSILIERGAIFNGNCTMIKEELVEEEKPEDKGKNDKKKKDKEDKKKMAEEIWKMSDGEDEGGGGDEAGESN